VTQGDRVSTILCDCAMTCDVEPATRDRRCQEAVSAAISELRSTRIVPRKVATDSGLARKAQAPRRWPGADAESRHVCVLIDIWTTTR
jgi:hypothetical protein